MAKQNPELRKKLIYDYLADDSVEEAKYIGNILKFLDSQGLGCSKSTVNKNLDFMVENDVILSYGKGRSTYYAVKSSFESMLKFKDELDADDFFSLEMASTSLEQLDFVELSADLNRIIVTLKKKRKEDEKRELIQFDQRNLKLDKAIFRNLFEAIKLNTVLRIKYKSFGSETAAIEHIFHPYFLKEFNKRWFVIGWNETFNNYSTFGIERIKKLSPLISKEFNLKNYISPKKYSKNLFGVSRIGVAEKVELSFAKKRAPYFESKQFLPYTSKQVKKDKIIYSIKAIINQELVAEILSYGKDIEVLKPVELRNEIKSILEEGIKNYK